MKRGIGLAAGLAAIAGAAVAAALVGRVAPEPAAASSHREAPLISEDPGADNTDLYAFRTADAPDTVTIVANYIPLEEPAGGPNFAQFDDDVLYAIHVDNTGDARRGPHVPVPLQDETPQPEHVPLQHRPDRLARRRRLERAARPTRSPASTSTAVPRRWSSPTCKVPPVNVGPRSTPGLRRARAVGGDDARQRLEVFAGQRDDPFFVDLGSIFDLGGLRPFNEPT